VTHIFGQKAKQNRAYNQDTGIDAGPPLPAKKVFFAVVPIPLEEHHKKEKLNCRKNK
jgi:hypothetical protein